MAKKFHSITYYQTMLVISIMIVLGGISFSYLVVKEYQRLISDFEGSVEQILASVEDSAANAVYTYNDHLAREIANGLSKFEPIVGMRLQDENGEVLAKFQKEMSAAPMNPFYESIFTKLNISNWVKTIKLRYADVSGEVIPMGVLIVDISKKHAFYVFLDSFFNLVMTAFIIVTVLGGVLIVVFQKIIAGPLIQVANAFSQFDVENPEQNKLPDPKDFPNNEFRVVVENGNKMLALIQQNLIQLRQSRDLLEQRVVERTADLQKLTQAVEQSPTMMFITNRSAKIEYANQKFFEFTGYTPEEVIGQNPRFLKSGHTKKELYQDLWSTIVQGNVWKCELQDRRRDGTDYWAAVTIAPIKDQEGEITHYLCAQEDISQRIQAMKEISNARDEAERANKSKSEFLSNMSHELRTPLNAILGFAQLMGSSKKHPLSEKQQGQNEQILKGGNHLLELINEVLELSKIEAGKLGLSVENVDCEDVVQDCISFAQTIADQYEIALTDSTPKAKPCLFVDRLRTKQVLMNLLSNAIKYNRVGGKVWIYGEAVENNMYRVSIVDTGYGIAEDKHRELFQPFSRLGAENSAIEGTGIGLALSRKLVTLMGGRIGFHSLPGKSSTFWVELPMAESETEVKANLLIENVIHDLTDHSENLLLYVEDNPTNLILLEEVVADLSNVRLVSANTAEQGLQIAQEKKPDLIILDINLPGMSGIEAVKLLKQNTATDHIPVVALSANAMPETIETAMDSGFDEYLTKPLEITKLFKVFDTYLESDSKLFGE